MNYLHLPNAAQVPLNPRPGYKSLAIAGQPEVKGRVVKVADDQRFAQVVWQSTPGTFRFKSDGVTVDIAYIVSGQAIIREDGRPPRTIEAGTLVEFPRETFEIEIVETLTKVSFLHHPTGLSMQPEPL